MGKHSSQKEVVDIGDIKKEVTLLEEDDKMVESQTLMECQSRPIKPEGREGFIVVKVPVVLSEFEVEINAKSSIRFDQPAVELLRVKKNVFLTECRLLPAARKLFLKGFVRKNIEFAAAKPKESKGGNNVRHITSYLPFNCTTLIEYFIDPVVIAGAVKCSVKEYNADTEQAGNLNLERDNSEYLNEGIYCALVKSRVYEIDTGEDEKPEEKPNRKTIQELNERLVIYLRLRLLQKQMVNIYGNEPITGILSNNAKEIGHKKKFSVNKSQRCIVYCRKR